MAALFSPSHGKRSKAGYVTSLSSRRNDAAERESVKGDQVTYRRCILPVKLPYTSHNILYGWINQCMKSPLRVGITSCLQSLNLIRLKTNPFMLFKHQGSQ